MTDPAFQEFCGCLRRIADLLAKGAPIQAAEIVAELNALYPRLPSEMLDDELAEARGLLDRCAQLEQGLRHQVVASLQHLAATRKSRMYRWYGSRP